VLRLEAYQLHGAKHQLKHRAKEKVTLKLVEKLTSLVLPRLIAAKKRLGLRIISRV
jgi:hypothetical protein